MELLQLRYFFESAKNESFTKTAEKYMVPTSSVSASVRNLEKELGCKLFDRAYNRITLNNNGKQLQQTLFLFFSGLDSTINKLTEESQDNREIKMLVRAMRSNITDYIIEYSKTHPFVTFKTKFDYEDSSFEDYDIIIDEKTDLYNGYECFELFNMRLRLKAASDSNLAGKRLTLKQLYNQSFVSLNEKSNMHKILIQACRRAGFSPNITAQINDIQCHEKMIASGICIGIGRENSGGCATEGVTYLDVSDFDERYAVFAYYNKDSAYGTVKNFLDFLKSKT